MASCPQFIYELLRQVSVRELECALRTSVRQIVEDDVEDGSQGDADGHSNDQVLMRITHTYMCYV